jgi:hypothetical protein
VYVADGGVFKMSGGSVSGNTANDSGGVYSRGVFEMSGGSVSGNTASGSGGGGVVVSNGSFEMSEGTISANTASSYGGGVYFSNGVFNMKDGAFIDQDNDVWIADNKAINIQADLTVTPYVARITPNSYPPPSQVLNGNIASNYDKFTVTPEDDGTEWEINSSGYLQLKLE